MVTMVQGARLSDGDDGAGSYRLSDGDDGAGS